jgi:hypothetical protein
MINNAFGRRSPKVFKGKPSTRVTSNLAFKNQNILTSKRKSWMSRRDPKLWLLHCHLQGSLVGVSTIASGLLGSVRGEGRAPHAGGDLPGTGGRRHALSGARETCREHFGRAEDSVKGPEGEAAASTAQLLRRRARIAQREPLPSCPLRNSETGIVITSAVIPGEARFLVMPRSARDDKLS